VRRWSVLVVGVIILAVVIVNLTSADTKTSPRNHFRSLPRPLARLTPRGAVCPSVKNSLPGMPAVLDGCDIYAADRPGALSPVAQTARSLIYVPNSLNDTVDEIDPATDRVVREFGVGALPQHVVPSWDLKTLWVTNDQGNSLTPIDPVTGDPGQPIHVEDPYNMYFTPDGHDAIVVAEALQRLDFRDPHTMALVHSLPVPCRGVDHMDFSANGTYLIASCEFAGELLKVDVASQSVVGTLDLGMGNEPQDVKLSPDGKVFYVADLKANGVWEVNGDSFRVLGFLPTGKGAHGLYVSRNSRDLYVSNRDSGTISVISFATGQVASTWALPPETGNHPGRQSDSASPDMGGVSADGRVLWLSGRYDSDVYAIDTTTGAQLARIPVGAGPHGLCVWPQPGRYSLGHTGILR
jgi:YVTN family beta-propeller protein